MNDAEIAWEATKIYVSTAMQITTTVVAGLEATLTTVKDVTFEADFDRALELVKEIEDEVYSETTTVTPTAVLQYRIIARLADRMTNEEIAEIREALAGVL